MDREDKFADLFDMLVESMIAKLKSGDIKHGDWKEIREFLRDNHIELDRMPGNMMDNLAVYANLPFSGEDE